jgi:hypothetical protein
VLFLIHLFIVMVEGVLCVEIDCACLWYSGGSGVIYDTSFHCNVTRGHVDVAVSCD